MSEHGYGYLHDPIRKALEHAIVSRLESKSEHNYQWPRWAAADEASHAAMEVLGPELEAATTALMAARREVFQLRSRLAAVVANAGDDRA